MTFSQSRLIRHDWFMQMHVGIPAQTPLLEAHDLGRAGTARNHTAIPAGDVLIQPTGLSICPGLARLAVPHLAGAYLAGSTIRQPKKTPNL